MPEIAPGVIYHPGYLGRAAQEALRDEIAAALSVAPPFRPTMPKTDQPFSVRMSNCGALGWLSDATGYRYQTRHPTTGAPWPAMPASLLEVWDALAGFPAPPEACLINLYDITARMGLHQDRDEQELDAPVLSLSLGDSAVFRIGGTARRAPTRSIRLASGDALLLSGPGRLAFHGIDRVIPQTSTLLPDGGRINLTLRRVTPLKAEPRA